MSDNVGQPDQADAANSSDLMSIDAPSVAEPSLQEKLQDALVTIARLEASQQASKHAISLEECIESLKTQVDRLSVEVSTDPTDAQNHSLRHTIKHLRDEIKSHKDTVRQLKKDQTTTGKEIQARDKQIEKQQHQLEARDAKIKEWAAKYKALEKKNSEAAEALFREKQLTQQVDAFKSSENNQLQIQLEQLKTILGEKEAVIESLQRDLDDKQPKQTSHAATQTDFRSTPLSRHFQRLSNTSLRLPLEERMFPSKDIGNLSLALSDDRSRQRLSNFLCNAKVNIWYCLVGIISRDGAPAAVTTSQGLLRCPLHTHTRGVGCTFLMMTQVDGIRKLQMC